MGERARRWRLRGATFLAAFVYFACGISLREASLLESQDLGIAADLFDTFAITADHSPLHFVFLSLWQRLSAHSLAFLRVPSSLACALAAVIVLDIAEFEGGVLGGLLAAAFFTLDPLVVDNARSLRMYAWVLLFFVASLGCAQAYLCRARRRSYLVGFAWAASLAIYTHLFSWLWVAPLAALLAVDLYRQRPDDASVASVRKIVLLSAVAWIPQVMHVFVALSFTRERHALYAGASAGGHFLQTVAQTLFLGENPPASLVNRHAVWLPVALVVLGLASARARSWVAVATIVLPGIAVAWRVSLSHEVEARYLNYLVPVLAMAIGVGIAKAKKPLLWAPLAIAVVYVSITATHASYAGPRTDWYAAAARVETIAAPHDVVAVFPGYWAATFRRYSRRNAFVPITTPIDLERLLERGEPVTLVHNGGRYFAHVQTLLRARASTRALFSTSVRDKFEVLHLEPLPPPPLEIAAPDEPAIVLTGVIGSGGYAWQHAAGRAPDSADGGQAFARLQPLFATARAVVSGYDAYDPPWYHALRWGVDGLRATRPNAEVVAAMRAAGISHVALRCTGTSCAAATALLTARSVRVLPTPDTASLDSQLIDAGVPIRIVYLSELQNAAGRARRVAEVKRSLPADGRLIVIVAQHGDYARTADATERAAARTLIDAGADVVAGEGGYAAREVEAYKAGVIAYSLGALLRPRTQRMSASDSSGIALRLRFPRQGPVVFQLFATTFDDRLRPALGRTIDLRRLVLPEQELRRRSCTDLLASAEATWADAAGVSHSLGAFQRMPDRPIQALPAAFDAWLESAQQWFPIAPKLNRLRPFDGSFARDGAYAGVRGVLALGEYRRAIELDTGEHARVRLRFTGGALHGPLAVAFALPDDRIASKSIPFKPQKLVLRSAGRELTSYVVGYGVGWTVHGIGARRMPDESGPLELELLSEGTHFPVAVDVTSYGPRVAAAAGERDPAKMAADPRAQLRF